MNMMLSQYKKALRMLQEDNGGERKKLDFSSAIENIKEARLERVKQGLPGKKYNTKQYRREQNLRTV